MAEKDLQLGMIVLMVSVFFLMSGFEILQFEFASSIFSMFVAYILVATGIYLIMKK